MLEQLGGNQFRRFSLSVEKRKVITGRPPANEEEQDAGWDYIIQHGGRDKGNLKQLRWIHRNINRDGSPIHGWNKKLVQKALGSLANDGTMAAVISRYDLTIDAVEPDVLEHIENYSPSSRPCSSAPWRAWCWQDPLRPNACHDVFTLSWRHWHLQIRQ